MVKVLPSTFTLFESQTILSVEAEPLCVHCSDRYVFFACEGCLIEAHDLSTNQKISRFRTIWPVSDLVYNAKADCIVTLERRTPISPAASRIYFMWQGIRQLEVPMRVKCLGSPRSAGSQRQDAGADVDAEILELPMENVTCLAVCELTGTIAVGSEKNIRLFTLFKDPTASLSTGGYRIVPFMDIRTDMRLKKVYICGQYIACTSTHRVRVLKFVILGLEDHPWSEFQRGGATSPPHPPKKVASMGVAGFHVDDTHFCEWSPSYIWEAESKMADARPLPIDSVIGAESPRPDHASSTGVISLDDTSTDEGDSGPRPELSLPPNQTSFRSNSHSLPNVGTLSLPSITQSFNNYSKKDPYKHELEVLGPVEYVWGQPLSVSVHEQSSGCRCWLLTMLYKRLPSSGFAYVHTSVFAESREKASTHGGGVQGELGRRRTATVSEGSLLKRTKGGIHTVQLVPTFATGKCNG